MTGDYISLSLKLEDGGLHFPKPEVGGWGTNISLSLKLEDGGLHFPKPEAGERGTTFP